MTSQDLLEVARLLVRSTSSDELAPACCRRSISSSYYAVFHALARLSADELIGDRTAAEWEVVYRALEHTPAKNALLALARETRNSGLERIAGTFGNLQVERHDADYGLAREFTRLEAESWIDFASESIDELARLAPALKRQLVVRLLFMSRPR